VVNLNKNNEEKEISTLPVNKVEEKCYRFMEIKIKEKAKSYEKIIGGPIKKEECEPPKKKIP
jgi:hypothetical protein